MDVERRKYVPRQPKDMEELANMLSNYPPMAGIYRGFEKGADGSVSLVFIHPDMEVGLQQCTQLYGDGTFKVNILKLLLLIIDLISYSELCL